MEMQRSQQKIRDENYLNVVQSANEIGKMESIAMFGDNLANLTPQASSIKLQDQEQEESTLILQQMGLEDSQTAAVYNSLPNNTSNDNVERAAFLQAEVKVPLTTKSAQNVVLDTSTGLLNNRRIENITTPS